MARACRVPPIAKQRLHQPPIFSGFVDGGPEAGGPSGQCGCHSSGPPSLALAGAIQPIWFLGAVALFGALRAGYNTNHAGSESGQPGSDYATAFNLVAFGGGALLYGLSPSPLRRFLAVAGSSG